MVEQYFEDDSLSPYKKNYRIKLAVVFVFIVILALIAYTTFFHEGILTWTGSAVKGNGSVATSDGIKINAQLTTPPLKLDDSFERVVLGGNLSSIYVGDQNFALSGLRNNYVVVKNYTGKIYFDSNGISELDGKADEVDVNGVPVSLDSGKKIKVYFDGVSDYDSLEIDDVYISKLSYTASGKITLNDGKNIFEVNNESVSISRFSGNIKGDKNEFNFDGYAEKVGVSGDTDISVGG